MKRRTKWTLAAAWLALVVAALPLWGCWPANADVPLHGVRSGAADGGVERPARPRASEPVDIDIADPDYPEAKPPPTENAPLALKVRVVGRRLEGTLTNVGKAPLWAYLGWSCGGLFPFGLETAGAWWRDIFEPDP